MMWWQLAGLHTGTKAGSEVATSFASVVAVLGAHFSSSEDEKKCYSVYHSSERV